MGIEMGDEYVKKLVIARLRAMPPNVSFSIGRFGDFSRDQLIEHVSRGTEIGQATIRTQLNFLKQTTTLSARLSP